jgi:Bacterial SH3 domain
MGGETMDKKLTIAIAALVAVLIGAGGFVLGRYVFDSGRSATEAMLLEEKTRDLENKNKQIEELGKQADTLRKDLDESGKQVAVLQSRLDQANQGLTSMQQKLKTARAPQASPNLPASGSGSGAADAGSYQVVRTTSVFQQASPDSAKLASIPRGTKVNVVRSVGDWLEVRSKHGKPPGYIRREDATYMGPN